MAAPTDDVGRLADMLVEALGDQNAGRIRGAARTLLAAGVTLPPAPVDPACVGKAVSVLLPLFVEMFGIDREQFAREQQQHDARLLHDKGLCACEANALLQRWLGAYRGPSKDMPGLRVQLGMDTSAYLDAHMLVEGDGR